MKRFLAAISLMLAICLYGSALAEGMGVQVIGGSNTATEPVSLDDIKLGSTVEIDGYGEITPTTFDFRDEQWTYEKGHPRFTDLYSSGKEAEYAVLKVNILNTTLLAKNFIAQCEVKVVFDDIYEYKGWFYQYNYNNEGTDPTDCVIMPDDTFAIDPMYVGHYCFGCTLPNAVVTSKKPLKMIITIDGNEITYNIRK